MNDAFTWVRLITQKRPLLIGKQSHLSLGRDPSSATKDAEWSRENSQGLHPRCPVSKTSPSKAGHSDSVPTLGAEVPYASRPKNQNTKQGNTITNSTNPLKMVHIKEKKKDFYKTLFGEKKTLIVAKVQWTGYLSLFGPGFPACANLGTTFLTRMLCGSDGCCRQGCQLKTSQEQRALTPHFHWYLSEVTEFQEEMKP